VEVGHLEGTTLALLPAQVRPGRADKVNVERLARREQVEFIPI
jgi:hypothetical protein